MISYKLNIADYRILLQAKTDDLSLEPAPAQLSFISEDDDFDIALNITRGPVKVFSGAEQVFKAPYVEEINGVRIKKNDKFWTVYKHGDYILIHTSMPFSETSNEALLIIRPGEKAWDIIIDSKEAKLNPLEYPLDGLLLYYLTALKGDIFIHGSGLNHKGLGFLFTGPSGKGKTTIARLFNEEGAKVIHDDRLIIRRMGDEFWMYNTPVYSDESSSCSKLDELYILNHGAENTIETYANVEAVTALMSNCIQHHWNSALIGVLTGAILDLAENIPVKRLSFVPDKSVVQYLENDR